MLYLMQILGFCHHDVTDLCLLCGTSNKDLPHYPQNQQGKFLTTALSPNVVLYHGFQDRSIFNRSTVVWGNFRSRWST